MTASSDAPTAGPKRPWLVTWTVLAGSFAIGINFTILAVSRPAIAADLNADVNSLVWLISGPILANALVTATAGKFGDLFGHRRVYLYGIVGSTVFAAASAAAWDSPSLIAFRVLGAVVGSAAGPASMAIINLMFTPERRSTALGYWSLVAAGGPVVGLVIGGPMVDAFGWRTIFAIQVPLLISAGVAAFRVLPETPRASQTQFDVAGNVALAVSLLAGLGAVERGRSWGWTSGLTIGALVVCVAAGALFVRIENRVEHPLIPVQYFARRRFVVPMVVIFFAQFGYMGGFILAPKLLAEVGNETATHISTLLIPRPLTFALAGAAAGFLAARVGIRPIVMAGTAMVVVSLAMISGTVSNLTTTAVIAAIALSGLGMGMVQPAVSSSIANSVSNQDLGVAGATQQMVVQVSTSLGMNLLDTVQAGSVGGVGLVDSYVRAYHLGAAITVVGLAAAWWLPRGIVDHSDAGAEVLSGVE